jgi:hypothetical protein
MAYVEYWSRTVAIDVLLSFNFDVIFYPMYFRFLSTKQKQNEKSAEWAPADQCRNFRTVYGD